jgi:cytoskeletal protein CcmA (bactofilin family)
MSLWKRLSERRRREVPAPPPPPQPGPPETSPSAFLAEPAQLRSSLSEDAVITGKLNFTAPTRIDGTLRGEVRATELLVIGESGFVDAVIRSPKLVILGHAQGAVVKADHVEIGPGASFSGRLETRALVVREGARLNGECRVRPPMPAAVETAQLQLCEALGNDTSDPSTVH